MAQWSDANVVRVLSGALAWKDGLTHVAPRLWRDALANHRGGGDS
jgi:hypothetical protein